MTASARQDYRRLLGLLFMRPDESFYVREIARLTGVDAGNAHHAFAPLRTGRAGDGSASRQPAPLSGQPESPIFAELQGIVRKTEGLADALGDALEPLAARVEQFFVFGSIARSEPGPRSDVDLMVVGTVTFSDVIDAVYPLHERLGCIGRREPSPEDARQLVQALSMSTSLGKPALRPPDLRLARRIR